ncbi:hypothetical protein GY45DRAFT_838535 [Cubamyces sp. BRFM 1775]|nr:hypothetical protein GY45DRAFT_838535 [Cubamyces sp. BRFM 1775]
MRLHERYAHPVSLLALRAVDKPRCIEVRLVFGAVTSQEFVHRRLAYWHLTIQPIVRTSRRSGASLRAATHWQHITMCHGTRTSVYPAGITMRLDVSSEPQHRGLGADAPYSPRMSVFCTIQTEHRDSLGGLGVWTLRESCAEWQARSSNSRFRNASGHARRPQALLPL